MRGSTETLFLGGVFGWEDRGSERRENLDEGVIVGRPWGESAVPEFAMHGPSSHLWGRTRDSGLGLLFKFRRTRAGWNRGSGRGFGVESSRRVSFANESRLGSDRLEFAIPCSFV